MAFTYNVNTVPGTGGLAMYSVITTLISAGWVVKSSSDGTTYNSTGNQITGGGSGAGGMGNYYAWFRIQAPTSNGITRELCFQRLTSNAIWRVKYSVNAGFISGTPGATTVPAATDEVVIFGSGTDLSPAGSNLFGVDGAYNFSMMAGDSSIGYGFYWFGYTKTTTTLTSGFLLDILPQSTCHSLDTDTAVIYACGNGAFGNSLLSYSYSRASLGNSYMGVSPANILFGASLTTYAVLFPATIGGKSAVNAFSGKIDLLPVMWGRDSNVTSPFGYKGFSSILMAGSITNTSLDLITVADPSDYIALGYYLFPWNGAAVLS